MKKVRGSGQNTFDNQQRDYGLIISFEKLIIQTYWTQLKYTHQF